MGETKDTPFNQEEWREITEMARKAIVDGRGPQIPLDDLVVELGGFITRSESDCFEVWLSSAESFKERRTYNIKDIAEEWPKDKLGVSLGRPVVIVTDKNNIRDSRTMVSLSEDTEVKWIKLIEDFDYDKFEAKS